MHLKPSLGLRCFLSLVLATVFSVSKAKAEPTEKLSQTLTRTVASGLVLQSSLAKNLYKQEPYQAEYDVQIPYQEDETYYESVPYQEQETYTDYESYYDTEYVCHDRTDYQNECHNENICQTVSDPPQCQNENICREVSDPPRCSNENVCHAVSDPPQCRSRQVCDRTPGHEVCQDVEECGVNAQGNRICKTRHNCHNEPGQENCHNEQTCDSAGSHQECHSEQRCDRGSSHQECHNEQRCDRGSSHQVCHNEQRCESVPHTRQECGNEQVVKTRPVTKTRTVTKYRQEQRTRTVTKYRTETKCCVTKYRDVFDKQVTLSVVVDFPQGSELLGQESETFKVTMTSESAATLDIGKTVLGYKVAAQQMQGGALHIQLVLVPKYTADELGEKTITGLALDAKTQGAAITFNDQGLRPRVKTAYSYILAEKDSGTVVEQAAFDSAGDVKVMHPLQAKVSFDKDYVLKLRVGRTGPVLAAVVDFTAQVMKAKDPLNADDFINAALIQGLQLQGLETAMRLQFEDHAPLNPLVQTQYHIKIDRKAGFFGTSRKTIADVVLDRSKMGNQTQINLSLFDDLKVEDVELIRNLQQGADVFIDLEVIRTSPRLNGGNPISIKKSVALKVTDTAN